MKTLACGDLVAGCPGVIRAATEDEILEQAARHARGAHGLDATPELAAAVRAHIRDEAAPAGAGAAGGGSGAGRPEPE